MASSFRDLRVWQNAMTLATDIYRSTADFPRHELYGLSQQMRRAAVSVPSNIAEGKGQRTNKGFAQFLFHARGSLLELETQIEIAQALQYIGSEQAQRLRAEATGVGRSLSGLINSLSNPIDPEKFLADIRRPSTDD